MIRRFFGMIVFMVTILTASFGQNLFSRDDLVSWMHVVEKQAPKHAGIAMNKTGIFLDNLSHS